MKNYLVEYAMQNFWCNPEIDGQNIYRLARLTSAAGARNAEVVAEYTVTLPTKNETYHLFQIGQIDPSLLGLLTKDPLWSYDTWVDMGSAIKAKPIYIDVYNQNGIQFPRFEVFYRFTFNRNLIIAIKENSNLPADYAKDAIYVRFFNNSYFQKYSSQLDLFYAGNTFSKTEDLLSFQGLYEQYAALPGHVFCYCNGLLIDSISLVTAKIGQTVEFVYDSSAKHSFTVPMSSVQTFVSTLDSKTKYLLHDSLADNSTINYHQQIEIYIVFPDKGHYTGLYYHRNATDSHRMVTHRDYAIGVDYATNIQRAFKNLPGSLVRDYNQLSFKVIVRNGGFNHALVFENQRIQELYKLSDDRVQQAIVGVNATCPVWQAAALEDSYYASIMQMQYEDITPLSVQQALGYHALSKLYGDLPVNVYTESSQRVADVPIGLQKSYCAYEYDKDGRLLGYQNSLQGAKYSVQNATCERVELLFGQGGTEAPTYFGKNTVSFDTRVNFRVYQSSLLTTGVSSEDWTDITETNLFTVNDQGIALETPSDKTLLMIRTDERIVNYDLAIPAQSGVVQFSLTEQQNRDGTLKNYLASVPMGDITVFLNQTCLIENIDYFIEFPNIVVTNIKALNQPAKTAVQNIHVRMSGFCYPDMTYRKADHTGFIVDGTFSNSRRYDLMDDSVNRIVVGGALKTVSDLKLNDDDSTVRVDSAFNGLPYSIVKPMVPIRNLEDTHLLAFIDEAKTIDNEVANYLTHYLPNPTIIAQTIPSLYPVVSPFFCTIINQLIDRTAPNLELIQPNMSEKDIVAFCKPYEKFLSFDPISVKNRIDPNFVLIVPTSTIAAIELPFAQYQFLLKAISLYAKNPLVNVASYIKLKPL